MMCVNTVPNLSIFKIGNSGKHATPRRNMPTNAFGAIDGSY